MSTRYGIAKNQFGDYFYNVEAEYGNPTSCTILYDLAEDKIFITMATSKITIDGIDYLATSSDSGIYGLYYL